MHKGDPRFWNWLAAVLLVSVVYSALHTFTRWIPHDEGVLAQMAERALSGELPHADFDEIYSGGLTFLNALSFVLFGARLSSMRITLFVFHLGFLASLFSIATRAARPPVAALFLFATTYAHPTSWSRIHLCLLLFYLAFGVLWLNTGNVRTTGVLYLHSDADQLLLPERANLRVRGSDKEVYETLVHVIDRLAGGDPYIMATPDCPEVYFLSRRKNPTRVLNEFLDPVQPTPRQLLEQLTTKGVRVVVLNSRPEFSQPVSHELYATLTEVYSQHTDVGWFRVLWKD